MTKAEGIGVKTVTITWEEIPKHQRNGFIRSYTIFYQAEGGEAFGEGAPATSKTPGPLPWGGGAATSPRPSAPWALCKRGLVPPPRHLVEGLESGERGVSPCRSVGTGVNPVACPARTGHSWQLQAAFPPGLRVRRGQTRGWCSAPRRILHTALPVPAEAHFWSPPCLPTPCLPAPCLPARPGPLSRRIVVVMNAPPHRWEVHDHGHRAHGEVLPVCVHAESCAHQPVPSCRLFPVPAPAAPLRLSHGSGHRLRACWVSLLPLTIVSPEWAPGGGASPVPLSLRATRVTAPACSPLLDARGCVRLLAWPLGRCAVNRPDGGWERLCADTGESPCFELRDRPGRGSGAGGASS